MQVSGLGAQWILGGWVNVFDYKARSPALTVYANCASNRARRDELLPSLLLRLALVMHN